MLKQNYVDFSGTELIRLLCGDSVKSWVRTKYALNGSDQSLEPCELKLIYQFQYNANTTEGLPFYIHLNPDECNNLDSISVTGTWSVIDDISGAGIKDTLILVSGNDSIKYGIRNITSLNMKLTGMKNSDQVETDFEWINFQ